jgi:hypothetical protein
MPNASQKPTHPSTLTLGDRLEHGNLTIAEVLQLKPRSKTGFYADVKAGLVKIRKNGHKSIIAGPIAKRYIADEPPSE